MTTTVNPYADDSKCAPDPRACHSCGLITGVILLVFVLCIVSGGVAFFVGVILGESRAYHRRAMEQMDQIKSYIADHQDKYGAVDLYEASSGYAYMMGTVNSTEDFQLLKSEMQRIFGEQLAQEMTWRVHVQPSLP